MSDPGRWSSPSDLAEFAYCPRARHYREQLGAPAPNAASRAGVRYHRRVLGGELRRERFPALWWALVLIGAVLLLLAALHGVGV